MSGLQRRKQSEDLVIHLLDKPKADTEETSGDEAQSSNKEAKKHLKADQNKWTARQSIEVQQSVGPNQQ